jgi:hypothetical protein
VESKSKIEILAIRKEIGYKLAQFLEVYYLVKYAPEDAGSKARRDMIEYLINMAAFGLHDDMSTITNHFRGIRHHLDIAFHEINDLITKEYNVTPEEFCSEMDSKNKKGK